MSHPTAAALTRAHRAWWPWAVLVIVLTGTAASNQSDPPSNLPVWLGVLLAVAAAVPALLPSLTGGRAVAGLIASGALSGTYFALDYTDGPVFFALPAVTFVVASAAPVAEWLKGAFFGAGLLGCGLWMRWLSYHEDPSKSWWQAIGVLGVVMAAGAVATATRNRAEVRTERIERAATEERLRMAQDLHDGVGHGLAVIAMQAGAALHVLDRDPAKARASLEAIRATSKDALDALRSELAVMSSGAPRRPNPGLADIPALLDRVRATGLRVNEVTPIDHEVAESVGEVAYVVVQEALTNVLRHAGATTVTVEWTTTDGRWGVAVRDDGRGGAVQDEGMGISGMRTRVERIGGSLQAGPRDGGGFQVVAELPA